MVVASSILAQIIVLILALPVLLNNTNGFNLSIPSASFSVSPLGVDSRVSWVIGTGTQITLLSIFLGIVACAYLVVMTSSSVREAKKFYENARLTVVRGLDKSDTSLRQTSFDFSGYRRGMPVAASPETPATPVPAALAAEGKKAVVADV
ncbi:MAG: hypothetical protein SGCHY_000561 [Lobulomycetales sp.]